MHLVRQCQNQDLKAGTSISQIHTHSPADHMDSLNSYSFKLSYMETVVLLFKTSGFNGIIQFYIILVIF